MQPGRVGAQQPPRLPNLGHGLRRWQLDPAAGVIQVLELTGLAWDVVRAGPARRERKPLAARAAEPSYAGLLY